MRTGCDRASIMVISTRSSGKSSLPHADLATAGEERGYRFEWLLIERSAD